MGVFDNKKVYLRRRSLRLRQYAFWGCVSVIAGSLLKIGLSGPDYTKSDRPTTSLVESTQADIARSRVVKKLKERLESFNNTTTPTIANDDGNEQS